MTSTTPYVIEISGDAGLRAAQAVAAQLRQALAAHDAVAVATGAITGADITTIQLLLSARRQAEISHKSLSLTEAPSGVFRDLLVASGCLSSDGRPLTQDGGFWTPQTRQDKGLAA